MRINREENEVAVSGSLDRIDYGISLADAPHVMRILRSTLYSDKMGAVLREYGANAFDANREAGRGDQPIEVELPTESSPELVIRDFGPGLSPERIRIFVSYGASTKRDSDEQVGMLGIGSKAGFAYTSSFVVESRWGGRRRTYAANVDAAGGGMDLLDDAEAAPGDTGVTIRVPVDPDDIGGFRERAPAAFRFYDPRPKCNVPLREAAPFRYAAGDVDVQARESTWTAVMGCVGYPVALKQLGRELPRYAQNLSGVLLFPVGGLDVAASREALEYTPRTRKALLDKLFALVDEHVSKAVQQLLDGTTSTWQKRVAALDLRPFKGLSAVKPAHPLMAERIPIPDGFDVRAFRLKPKRSERSRVKVDEIDVTPISRLVLRDDDRALGGFSLFSHDYIVAAPAGLAPDQRRAFVEERGAALAVGALEGIPVARTSQLDWTPSQKARPKPAGPRRRIRRADCYRYVGSAWPRSGSWEPAKREPQESDVFVVFDRFEAPTFYPAVEKDRRLALELGFPFPDVYGYRVAEAGKARGRHYDDYRADIGALASATPLGGLIREARALRDGVRIEDDDEAYWPRLRDEDAEALAEVLGPDHPVAVLVRGCVLAKKLLAEQLKNVEGWKSPDGDADTEARRRLDEAKARWPLLFAQERGLGVLAGEEAAPWIEYVKMADAARQRGKRKR